MKTVVIGCGAAGASAALFLARAGREVLALEAGAKPLPLLRGFSRGGLHFDTGFHQAGALDEQGILRAYLKLLGLWDSLNFIPYRDEGCEFFRFLTRPEKDISIPQGLTPAARALSGLWPGRAEAIASFFAGVREHFRQSPFINPSEVPLSGFNLPSGKSAREYFAGLNLPARLEGLLTARSIFYGTLPERAAFEDLSIVTHSTLEGVGTFDQGGLSLALAFEKALARAGVRVQCKSEATAINLDAAGAVVSVTLSDKTEIPCNACVYTGHPGRLPRLLSEQALRPSNRRHLESLEDTLSVFMVYGQSKSPFVHGRGVYLCHADTVGQAHSTAEFTSAWLHLTAGQPAEDGRYPVAVGAKLPEHNFPLAGKRRPDGYAAWKEEQEERLAAHVRKYLPELGDFTVLDSITDRSMRQWIHGGTGSIYGVMHAIDQMPVMPATRIKGLTLAGQSIILPGLLGTIISAVLAAGFLAGFEPLMQELREYA